MSRIYVLLLFFLLGLQCLSQDSYFDSIYKKTSLELISTDPEEALKNADLLHQISDNKESKLKTILLKAEILRAYGLKNEAIDLLIEANSFSTLEKDYVAITQINRSIASTYRIANLKNTAEKYLEIAIESSSKIKDKNLKIKHQGELALESSYIKFANEKYHEAIDDIRKGIKYFLMIKSSDEASSMLTLGYLEMGENYLALKNSDSAFYYFKKSENQLSNYKNINNTIEGYIFKGIAATYIEKKAYKEAENYFLKAKTIADESSFFDLKKDVYRAMSIFYKNIGNNQKYIDFNDQYLKLIETEQVSRRAIANKLITNLYLKEIANEDKHQKKIFMTTVFIVWLVLIIGLLSYYIYKKKSNHRKFKAFIEGRYKNVEKSKPIVSEIKTELKKEKSYMTEDKEQSILKALNEIEETEFYLAEDISLNLLSSKIGVNQRYLTYVIKKRKATDFATYINELRINYIVDKLKTNPKFLLYKIKHLAILSGFASHSTFTINFKKITGTTPSAYINFIRDQQEKNSEE